MRDEYQATFGGSAVQPEYLRCNSIPHLFEKQVERVPDQVALTNGYESLSYIQLNLRANRLAHRLIEEGVTSGSNVCIALARSMDYVIAVLAILKAGGVYVPLDLAAPPQRLRYILLETQPKLLLTYRNWNGCDVSDLSTARLDLDIELTEHLPVENTAIDPDASSPAYVMYTSGTSGDPKGVVVPHRAIVRLVFKQDYVPFEQEQTFLLLAPVAFDASTFELWGALLHGSKLAIYDGSVADFERLEACIERQQVSCLWLTASLFNTIVDLRPQTLRSVRYILTGGEALSVQHVARALKFLPETTLINGYGPTEGTTFTLTYRIPRDLDPAIPSIPIGTPLHHTHVYILDTEQRPVNLGAAGELYIAGEGLALGYYRSPELTARKFIPDPFATLPGKRMYRSGDRCKLLADGSIVFLGRLDHQIKLHGHRMEAGEIEAWLIKYPGIQQAAVTTFGEHAERKLVAYVTLSDRTLPEACLLRQFLRQQLPEYMIPSQYVPLKRLPLKENGKLDYLALPDPQTVFDKPQESKEEIGETCHRLCELISAILALNQVRSQDSFLHLGGNSLKATVLVLRVREAFGVVTPLAVILTDTTISDLANWIDQQRTDGMTPLDEPIRQTAALLSSAQERLWFFDQLYPDSPVYHIGVKIDMRGTLNIKVLQNALALLLERHEVLRTRIVRSSDGQPKIQVNTVPALELQVTDLSKYNAQEQLRLGNRRSIALAATAIPLYDSPLLRTELLRYAEEKHTLICVIHHIACDAWSLTIFLRDLMTLYDFADGVQTSALSKLPIRYVDYAVWQQQRLAASCYEKERAYWKAKLANVPLTLALPTDRPRPYHSRFQGSWAEQILRSDELIAIRSYASKHEATLFMVAIAALGRLLGAWCQQDDLIIGASTVDRPSTTLEPLIGLLINTVPIRIQLTGQPEPDELLRQVRNNVIEALANQGLPFQHVVESLAPTRKRNHAPVFQVVVSCFDRPETVVSEHGLSATLERICAPFSGFDLTFYIEQRDSEVLLQAQYDRDLFESETIERLLLKLRIELLTLASGQALAFAGTSQEASQIVLHNADNGVRPVVYSELNLTDATSVEGRLAAIWCKTLGLKLIDLDRDFFESGGHSLLATKLLWEIERELAVRLPLAVFMESSRFSDLVEQLKKPDRIGTFQDVLLLNKQGNKPPLLFLHGAGGHPMNFRALVAGLDSEQPCVGLAYGEASIQHKTFESIENLASRLIDSLAGHLHGKEISLCGYSLGGLIAYEMAVQMHAKGYHIAVLMLIDAYLPGALKKQSTTRRYYLKIKNALTASPAVRSKKLRSLVNRLSGGLWKPFLSETDRRPKADDATLQSESERIAVKNYQPRPYSGKLTLISASDRKDWCEYFIDDPHLGWASMAPEIELFTIEAKHLQIMQSNHVKDLSRIISDSLSRKHN